MNQFLKGEPNPEGKNVCRFCGVRFYHTDEDLTVCRSCWSAGREIEERLAPVLAELRKVNANASVVNTGGNCMVIQVGVEADKPASGWYNRYCYLTDADDGLPEDDGMSEGQRWVVGYYEADDDDEECVETIGFEPETRADGHIYAKGVTLAEALEYLLARRALCDIQDDYKDEALASWKPADGFTALHDVVDANEYLEKAFFSVPLEDLPAQIERANRVMDLIESRLAELEA